jgi:hypothetical protein
MTRDEAIERLKAVKFSTELSMDGTDCKLTSAAPFVIDALAALGLLKLELAEHEAIICLRHHGFDVSANNVSANTIVQFLIACGFKITKDGSSK